MFTLLTRLAPRELLLRQAPILAASLLIAEIFYKFHSFLLETGAFLVTWFVLDALAGGLARAFGSRNAADRGAAT
jgi:hypothetical protein